MPALGRTGRAVVRWLLKSLIPAVIFIAIVVSFVPHDMMYGCQAALIAECFSPRLRYSGSALGFHLASIVAGGPAPIIVTALYAATGSPNSIACYIRACAVISVVTTLFLPDYTNLAEGRLRRGTGPSPRKRGRILEPDPKRTWA